MAARPIRQYTCHMPSPAGGRTHSNPKYDRWYGGRMKQYLSDLSSRNRLTCHSMMAANATRKNATLAMSHDSNSRAHQRPAARGTFSDRSAGGLVDMGQEGSRQSDRPTNMTVKRSHRTRSSG